VRRLFSSTDEEKWRDHRTMRVSEETPSVSSTTRIDLTSEREYYLLG